ncbi:mitochondrial Complex V (CV) F1Fo ATP synthase F1 subunit delta Atp16/AtpC [Andalucia godoyi]|uniref:Mitochondrial Complex V (CV) F1Fo ATP synthase F1 subunit delta Atp16/AtpC n=1 Tax=Andalucia godoyi TaxID=505711 RepID=A0A8K0AHB8_ANDGO|nr:mitochondrial Complex V (CV) F1Fo ATP synthase F1 subunit delta Atp16/AtpC [Andalucia godoyi]|eukprot:ANDGO_02539.mRNA.1 mitochondrial Complex V (CV) F1Fo ATP synthase F1 subunit delta Atp16/AtpC
MFSRVRPFLRAAEAATEAVGTANKLTLNFMLPHEPVLPLKSKVELVTIPGTSGVFGVMPNHVPTIAQLKPGVVTVQFSADKTEDYFVSGGFAWIRPDSSLDITAGEAVKLADVDVEAVKKGLTQAQQETTSAQSDVDKARAQIHVEVYEALAAALNIPRA